MTRSAKEKRAPRAAGRRGSGSPCLPASGLGQARARQPAKFGLGPLYSVGILVWRKHGRGDSPCKRGKTSVANGLRLEATARPVTAPRARALCARSVHCTGRGLCVTAVCRRASSFLCGAWRARRPRWRRPERSGPYPVCQQQRFLPNRKRWRPRVLQVASRV